MSAISQDLQKTAGRRTLLFAIAVAILGISAYIYFEPSLFGSQDTCIAAHALDYGVTPQQLTRDASYQSELVAALSSCSGMTP
ncbi:hypothetical protein [Collimonas silvisoli]|uniref:hypothetical protein n=1 Tax=Collimonas silvisoli TaxID=2825884 RepID=UPI001B8B4F0E|nr:hypothetical protein [Collimonas silvisoli]